MRTIQKRRMKISKMIHSLTITQSLQDLMGSAECISSQEGTIIITPTRINSRRAKILI